MDAPFERRIVFGWVPLARVEIRCDDDLGPVGRQHAALALHIERIHIQNSEQLAEGNLTSEFVQYDSGLPGVAVPPAHVAQPGGEGDGKGLLGKRRAGLAGAGGAEVDDDAEVGTDPGRLAKRHEQTATAGKFD